MRGRVYRDRLGQGCWGTQEGPVLSSSLPRHFIFPLHFGTFCLGHASWFQCVHTVRKDASVPGSGSLAPLGPLVVTEAGSYFTKVV